MRRPLFIARQASGPSGLVGRIIAAIMVRETAETNRAAIAALRLTPGEHVLDIGCGSGHSIELLIPLVGHGSVSGVDPSPLMAARAKHRNAAGSATGRVAVVTAAVEQLPFGDQTFTAVMSVHTLYFWEHLGSALAEIHRVIRICGRLVLVFRSAADKAAVASFPREVYCIRSLAEIEEAVVAAGFVLDAVSADGPDSGPAMLIAHRL